MPRRLLSGREAPEVEDDGPPEEEEAPRELSGGRTMEDLQRTLSRVEPAPSPLAPRPRMPAPVSDPDGPPEPDPELAPPTTEPVLLRPAVEASDPSPAPTGMQVADDSDPPAPGEDEPEPDRGETVRRVLGSVVPAPVREAASAGGDPSWYMPDEDAPAERAAAARSPAAWWPVGLILLVIAASATRTS